MMKVESDLLDDIDQQRDFWRARMEKQRQECIDFHMSELPPSSPSPMSGGLGRLLKPAWWLHKLALS